MGVHKIPSKSVSGNVVEHIYIYIISPIGPYPIKQIYHIPSIPVGLYRMNVPRFLFIYCSHVCRYPRRLPMHWSANAVAMFPFFSPTRDVCSSRRPMLGSMGRNPATGDRQCPQLFTGFYTYHVVQEFFFHRDYDYKQLDLSIHWVLKSLYMCHRMLCVINLGMK